MKKYFLLVAVLILLASSIVVAQEEYFGKNKVTYKSFNWEYIQTPNFDLYFYDGEYELAKFAVEELEIAYEIISDELDYRLKGRLPVFLYNSHNEFQQTNVTPGILPEGVGGFTESFKNRIVIPHNGSYEDLRHVLHHELTHGMIFDMVLGNVIGSLVSRQYLFRLPLWFSEGYAEYSSRFGWDYWADMIVRDAVINDYLVPLDYLGGYLAYKEGQMALKYLTETYGDEKIKEILNKGRTSLSMNKAMKSSIGLTVDEFYKKMHKWMKRVYWPELAIRQEPEEFAKSLTNHEKDGSYFNEKPAFSPQGDKIAIFSDRSDYTEIYMISAIDGKTLKRLVKSGRSGDLESLHSYVSGLSWSPDGDNLVFIAKSGGEDALVIYDVEDGKVTRKFKPGFNSMLSPSWGSDNRIAFTGLVGGNADVYIFNTETEELKQLTDDRYDDKDLAFSPDGKKLAFASDRPLNTDESDGFQYGIYNIFVIDLETNAIDTITHEDGLCRYPTWSPDSKKLCYTSNLNGIDNLYITDLTDSNSYPISNILSGINSPSWSPNGDEIVFAAYNKGGYDIFLLKEIKPVTENGEPLEKTKFAKGELVAGYQGVKFAGNGTDSSTAIEQDSVEEISERDKPKDELELEDDQSDFVFVPEDVGEVEEETTSTGKPKAISGELENLQLDGDGRDTLYAISVDGEYEIKKYKTKFTPDMVSGGVSYDAYYGMRGQSFILLSDYLGNHQFIIATDLVQSINNSNILVYYLNNKSRINYGLGLFHNKNFFFDPLDRLFSDRTYGVSASFAYPFSVFRRFQLDMSHIYIDRTYFDPRFVDGRPIYDDSNDNATSIQLSFVNDKTLWGFSGPANGNRWKITLERTIPISSRSKDYWAVEADYRKYWHIKGAYSFALRMAGGVSMGDNRKSYYLGGTTNYIGGSIDNNNAYTVQGFYFSKVITPLRGYDYFEFVGSKYAVVNLELRYPFIEYLITRFPLPLFLSRITGAIFFDAGAAWNENETFKGATSKGNNRLLDIKTGFGTGARVNLGFFLLRYDVAWPWNFDNIGKPKHYFSFGAEF